MEIDIHKLLSTGEHKSLECKKASNGFPNSLWETYSAFANTDGGVILLGVSEKLDETDMAKRFSVVGVDSADKICKDFWNIINSPDKVNVNLLQDEDVQIFSVEGKSVIAINVPRAEYTVRPVFINNNPLRGTFKRNNEGDYHCTVQEIRMMLRDSDDIGNDRMLLEHYTMDDIDIPTLESYRVMFKTDNPQHLWNGLSHKEFLTQLGGYTVNRKDGTEGLTMAGLLMFGKGLPVRERFDNLRMDYIDKSGLVGDQRYSDRLTYDGTWENNLFNFIRLVVPKLTRDLPKPFRMEGVVRKDDTPQAKAIREAVTNMVIHSDFLLDASVLKIEKYDDRLVLTNPGLLKLPVEQIYRGGESKARNQRMQNMLRMIGYGENLGSGFPLILSAWNEKHWLEPELIEQPDLMQVKLILHIYNLSEEGSPAMDDTVNDTVNERLSGCDSENKHNANQATKQIDDTVNDPVKSKLTERQILIMKMMRKSPSITGDELLKALEISIATLRREIATLRKAGYISREGSDKTGTWVVLAK